MSGCFCSVVPSAATRGQLGPARQGRAELRGLGPVGLVQSEPQLTQELFIWPHGEGRGPLLTGLFRRPSG